MLDYSPTFHLCDSIVLETEEVNFRPNFHRQSLFNRFESRMLISDGLTRRLLSYQGNKNTPGFRWMRYKEAFSTQLVEDLLSMRPKGRVLDPFSGSGTTALTAGAKGSEGIGLDILPIGNQIARSILEVAKLTDLDRFSTASDELLKVVQSGTVEETFRFKHLRITELAFSKQTENDLARARQFISQWEDRQIARLLNFACMSSLEDISFTRKDGQFLRWDSRSGRCVSTRLNKGPLPSLYEALAKRFSYMKQDAHKLRQKYSGSRVEIIEVSCLDQLSTFDTDSIDTVITSPPYANRYDYTRTYALELAFLEYDQKSVKQLRQSLLSATVENRQKQFLGEAQQLNHLVATHASDIVTNLRALQEVICDLEEKKDVLSNLRVIDLVRNYFLELTMVIIELVRVCRRGANVFMIADNVQYAGIEVPVDVILSAIAEECGFNCVTIYVLKRGKGNSSQQMKRFGRKELRKCMYHWVKYS